jgi:hypothetical protein
MWNGLPVKCFYCGEVVVGNSEGGAGATAFARFKQRRVRDSGFCGVPAAHGLMASVRVECALKPILALHGAICRGQGLRRFLDPSRCIFEGPRQNLSERHLFVRGRGDCGDFCGDPRSKMA